MGKIKLNGEQRRKVKEEAKAANKCDEVCIVLRKAGVKKTEEDRKRNN